MAQAELPLEMMIEVFIRLPVKHLFRFKCISKSWNSLISSHFKSNPKLNIIITPRWSKSFFSALIHDNDNDDNHNNDYSNLHFSNLNLPFKLNPAYRDTSVSVIDSCNGILLISDISKETMFLYNPANNTHRLIPPIKRPLQRRWFDELLGFGYDSRTDNYKVISLVQNLGVNLEMYVYNVRENVWKFVKDESPSVKKYVLLHGKTGNALGVKGVLYFQTSVPRDYKPVLVCFDVRTEVFSTLDYPELECYDFYKVSICLSKLNGFLCMAVNYQSRSHLYKRRELRYADVWKIREGGPKASWVKLFRIKNNEVVGKGSRCTYLKLMAYSKDKGKVLVEVNYARLVNLVWYDLVTKRVEEVKTHGLPTNNAPFVAMTYVSANKAVSVSVQK